MLNKHIGRIFTTSDFEIIDLNLFGGPSLGYLKEKIRSKLNLDDDDDNAWVWVFQEADYWIEVISEPSV